MTRRNSTSRRVQAFSSGSMRSDEIAATDRASRDGSRVEVSDIAFRRSQVSHFGRNPPALGAVLARPDVKINRLLRQIKRP